MPLEKICASTAMAGCWWGRRLRLVVSTQRWSYLAIVVEQLMSHESFLQEPIPLIQAMVEILDTWDLVTLIMQELGYQGEATAPGILAPVTQRD
jgi:hypothetical protein